MPIETNRTDSSSLTDTSVGSAFVHYVRETQGDALAKITHCVDQLAGEDLQWRQFGSHNSIQNMILHLCRNLHQWIGYTVGGAPDIRDRPAKFSDRRPQSKSELMTMLRNAVAEADETLAAFPPDRLPEHRQVQGVDSTLLGATLDSVHHFVRHTHQIVFVTRLRLGDVCRFQWIPQGIDHTEPD